MAYTKKIIGVFNHAITYTKNVMFSQVFEWKFVN